MDIEKPKIEITVMSDTLEITPKTASTSIKNDIRFEHLQEEYDAALKRAEERDAKNIGKIQELAEIQIKLQIQINSLNNSLEKKNLENTYLQEKIQKLSIENFESQYFKCREQVEDLTTKLHCSEDHINKLEIQLEEFNELAISLSAIKPNACHFHDEENQKLQQQNSQLKQKILEIQKSQEKKLSDKLEAELIRQIKDLDEKLENSEFSKQELISEINELKQEILNHEKIIYELKGFIEGSKTERISLKDDRSRSPKSLRRKDSIDRSLEEYHAGQGIKNYFVKFSRGLYEFGNRKVNVSMKNGTIICRVGGGYVQIEDFLNIYMASLSNSPRKGYTRNQSTSPLRNSRSSFAFLESISGKQTPVMDSVFDTESLLTYSRDSRDSDDDKSKNKKKNYR